jgi:hypothetical protein
MERDHKYCCALGMRLASYDTKEEILEVSAYILGS